MSYGVAHRCGSALELPRLWSRPVAVAPSRPLAWKPQYAMGAAQRKKKNENNEATSRFFLISSF